MIKVMNAMSAVGITGRLVASGIVLAGLLNINRRQWMDSYR